MEFDLASKMNNRKFQHLHGVKYNEQPFCPYLGFDNKIKSLSHRQDLGLINEFSVPLFTDTIKVVNTVRTKKK